MILKPLENTKIYGMKKFFNEIIHYIMMKKCQIKFYYLEKEVLESQL